MDVAEATIRGFFVGLIVAQFIPGWISGIIIVLVLIASVFLGSFLRTIGRAVLGRIPDAIAKHLPDVLLNRFVEGVFTPPASTVAGADAHWMMPAAGPPTFHSPFDQHGRNNV